MQPPTVRYAVRIGGTPFTRWYADVVSRLASVPGATLVAMVEGDPAAAACHFQAAILIERQHGVSRPQMRYLSYYGLALAQSRGATPEAIQACETAARRDFFSPDLLLNLGRVYLLAGKTTKALATLERGVTIAPNHKTMRSKLEKASSNWRYIHTHFGIGYRFSAEPVEDPVGTDLPVPEPVDALASAADALLAEPVTAPEPDLVRAG